MSNKINYRREHGRIQDNGPTWEGEPPESGCNSTHVARARRWWKKKGRRSERRTGEKDSSSVRYHRFSKNDRYFDDDYENWEE